MSKEDAPFKMKGSPMQRNFGIGSPVKQHEDKPKAELKDKMMMKEMKTLKKKEDAPNWSKKLDRQTKRREKLRAKQAKRKGKGKSTERVERREERLQNKINKEYYKLNPKGKTKKGKPEPAPEPAPELPNTIRSSAN